MKVLLVEDNPGDANLVRTYLREAWTSTIDITCAEDLSSALASLEAGDFDIVLTDLALPDSDRTQTFDHIRDAATDVAIIVLTGCGDYEDALRAVRHGAQDYLVKGEVTPSELARAVRYSVERKAIEKALERSRAGLEREVMLRTEELRDANLALSHAMHAKDEFMASMSHELRTPLNSIIGFSGLMLQGLAGDLNEEQAKQLTMVSRSAHHLLDLINQILDLSRLDAGKAEIESTEFSPLELMENVVASVQPQATDKGIGLEFSAEGLPDGVCLDKVRLEQILLNLLGNAVKFTEEGTVTVRAVHDGSTLTVSVADTGSGIEREDVDYIFEDFYQVRASGSERCPGTGLGLPIARRLARLMGGDITVETAVGKGSQFTVAIPAPCPKDVP